MGMDSRGHPAGMPAKTKPMMVAGGMVGLLVGACTGERRAKKSSICMCFSLFFGLRRSAVLLAVLFPSFSILFLCSFLFFFLSLVVFLAVFGFYFPIFR